MAPAETMKKALILIGGYNSIWPAYLSTARSLEDLTGLRAVGVPLMPWDWWTAARAKDASNVLDKVERTVMWARRRFQAGRFILVGHSAGGVLARLYLSDQPVWGKTYAGVEQTAAIITLGSPHCGHKGSQTGWFLTSMANQLVPGTPFAGQVRYRTVAGRYLQGRQNGSPRERRAFRVYEFFHGKGDVWGDGLVPVGCSGLSGAETMVLEGIAHSRKVARHWYGGSKSIIRRWSLDEIDSER